jgi:hypothetical protein
MRRWFAARWLEVGIALVLTAVAVALVYARMASACAL